MKGKAWLVVFGALLVVGVLNPGATVRQVAADNNQPPSINLALTQSIFDATPAPADDPLLDANGNVVRDGNGNPVSDPNEAFHKVIPSVYDPLGTHLAQSTWLDGIGCPTDAKTATYGPPPNYPVMAGANYTDPACPNGDPKDQRNEGLLMVKTGPPPSYLNVVAAVAELKKVRGTNVSELGYDIRKNSGPTSPLGSHCGAGAPRFDVYTSDGLFFVGCNSPQADTVIADTPTNGGGFTRLRWGVNGVVCGYPSANNTTTPTPCPLATHPGTALITGTVQRIQIVFDEGHDTNPDYFGAAVLDNIDYNGTLVGRGPVGPGMQETSDNDDDD
jgi:hypothetical protein